MDIENKELQLDKSAEPSIEESDANVEEVVGDDDGGEVEVDADSLAAAAQGAGISEADSAEIEGDGDKDGNDEATEFENSSDTEKNSDAEMSDDTEDTGDISDESQDDEGPEEPEIVTSICTDEGVEVTVESVVEAVLFASDEPITSKRMVSIVETGSVKQIRECVKNLNEKYKQNNLAFRIERIAGGYQMMTLDAYNHWLRKMIRVRSDNKLTQASLETLSIIAYKQPIIRADVEGIRGVSSGEMIRSLMYKGLVRITGRAEVLGRPMLYGTTKKFLDVFGLNSTKDLPKLDELKKPQE